MAPARTAARRHQWRWRPPVRRPTLTVPLVPIALVGCRVADPAVRGTRVAPGASHDVSSRFAALRARILATEAVASSSCCGSSLE